MNLPGKGSGESPRSVPRGLGVCGVPAVSPWCPPTAGGPWADTGSKSRWPRQENPAGGIGVSGAVGVTFGVHSSHGELQGVVSCVSGELVLFFGEKQKKRGKNQRNQSQRLPTGICLLFICFLPMRKQTSKITNKLLQGFFKNRKTWREKMGHLWG